MKTPGTWHEHHRHHWHISLFHPSHSQQSNHALSLYSLRIAALAAVSSLWVWLILATGMFSVAAVILIGGAIGGAHLLLPHRRLRPHLPGALALTLIGGLFANICAGLALFSVHYGVSYWQILAAQQAPENWPALLATFTESFRLQDALYYLLALATAAALAGIRTRRPE